MIGELQRFWQDESGGVVDEIVVIGAVVLVVGPALIILSNKTLDLMGRIIRELGGVLPSP